MNALYEHYQHEADDALQMALAARTDDYRASWLRVAAAWLQMIPMDKIKVPAIESPHRLAHESV